MKKLLLALMLFFVSITGVYASNYDDAFYGAEKIKDIYMFPRCSSIHTFFMKQNIDICILDKNYKIVYLRKSLEKGKILIKKGYYTLEMPLNTCKSLTLGETLEIKK